MKAVRLTKANGLNERVQGDAGAVRLLEDDEAFEMVRGERAVYAPEHDPVYTYEIPVVKVADAPTPDQVLDLAGEGSAGESGLRDSPPAWEDQEDPLPALPWTTHPKAKWIDWALRGDHGRPRPSFDEVTGMTKNELMSRYGERL